MHGVAKRTRTDIVKYDPQRGLKTIAVSEAAEKHFARAKDLDNLIEAIDKKLEQQAEFVAWWDGQDKRAPAGPGRGHKTPSPKRDGVLRVGRNGIPERMVLSRWRKLLDGAKRKLIQAKAVERARIICEFDKTVRGTEGTGENEWFTPKECIRLAREVLGTIDLDPASSVAAQRIIKAKKYFTKETDGLQQEWRGKVWLNPPYMQPHIAYFMNKMVEEFMQNRVLEAIMLTHNYTDTEWFHTGAKHCAAICFTRGRIKFYNAEGEIAAPTQGQAFFYFGSRAATFKRIFNNVGFVVTP